MPRSMNTRSTGILKKGCIVSVDLCSKHQGAGLLLQPVRYCAGGELHQARFLAKDMEAEVALE